MVVVTIPINLREQRGVTTCLFCINQALSRLAPRNSRKNQRQERSNLDRSLTPLILPPATRRVTIVLVSYIPLALASARAGGVIALPAPPCTCFVFTSTDYRCAQPQFEPCGAALPQLSHQAYTDDTSSVGTIAKASPACKPTEGTRGHSNTPWDFMFLYLCYSRKRPALLSPRLGPAGPDDRGGARAAAFFLPLRRRLCSYLFGAGARV